MRQYLTTALLALGMSSTLAPGAVEAQATEPLLSQQMLVGFNFCPRGWAATHGQVLPINQNQSLYALLGTTYGGDGRSSFALPELRGRVQVGAGNSLSGSVYELGQAGGAERVTLTTANMAEHTHTVTVHGTTSGANVPTGNGALLATTSAPIYAVVAANSSLSSMSVTTTLVGGNQPFDIRMPYETIITCVALQGLFPPRN